MAQQKKSNHRKKHTFFLAIEVLLKGGLAWIATLAVVAGFVVIASGIRYL